jgi:hypothetical protein
MTTGDPSFRRSARETPVSLRTLGETDHGGTARVGKHLLDETAEFRMPRIPRHAAEHEDQLEDQLEATQRFDAGFGQQRRAPDVPQKPAAR